MTDQGQPAGWYHAEGDPPGTTRYWDGTAWQGGPQAAPVASGGGAPMGGMGGSDQMLASPGLRMAGRVIDAVLTGIVGSLLGAVSFDFDDLPSYRSIAAFAIFVLAYDALTTHFLGGTPGKLVLGMRVAEAESGMIPPTLPVASKRAAHRLLNLVPGVGSIIVGLIGLASLVMLFTDGRNQTVMDKFAGTVVVKK
jgi:uncharacterized RDD family membrane protein YckC